MKCTGRNCPMQYGTVDPSNCSADECPYVTKPLTNADRIRVMTDEELAKHLNCQWKECKNLNDDCDKCLLNWLKQEVDDG